MTGPVPKSRWTPLGKTGVHYWFVQRMAKTCGVDMAVASDHGDIDQSSWADMVQTCRSCQWTDGCERWLSRQDAATGATPPATCLNADILKLLAQEQDQ